MLSVRMRSEICEFASALARQHSLFVRMRERGLRTKVVQSYLSSLRYLISLSVPNLVRAADRAAALGQPELSRYFLEKIKEETGHDLWAEQDLSELSQHFSMAAEHVVVPAVVDLAALNRRLIDADPRLYLLYILCAEYVTVLVGPAWVEGLVAAGIPPGALTVVTKHVEADKDHAEDGFAVLNEFFGDGAEAPTIDETLRQVFAGFTGFCEDLMKLELEPAWESVFSVGMGRAAEPGESRAG